MGSALYIVAKDAPAQFDMLMDGKALARAEAELNDICASIGVKAPMEFFSQNPEELADMLGDEVPGLPPEQWFLPEEGLTIVRALLTYLTTNENSVRSSTSVITDLIQCERVLGRLQEAKLQWHFAIDI